jgi:PadR family transcriptional regulator PadR
MKITTSTGMLDSVVLAIVASEAEGTYGYKITQDVRNIMDVSESTLYPVLRRLQKDNCLDTYDVAIDGRNRRYYKITSNGMIVLDQFRHDWVLYKKSIDKILFGVEDEK